MGQLCIPLLNIFSSLHSRKKKIVNEMADFNVFCNVLLEMTMIFCNEVSLITAASGLHEQFTEQNTTCHSTTDGDKNLGLPSFSFVIQIRTDEY